MNFNKLCNREDFDAPELRAVMERVFTVRPLPIHRKVWEVALAVHAFETFGTLKAKGGAEILGVGAGCEMTVFYLTNHARRVHATDIYVDSGSWKDFAPSRMLTAPEQCAPAGYEWQPERLIVQHMDGRTLRYPDNTFDGVFSSGSIEHFGGLDDVARSAREIGRVLKPGGVAAISTEFKLNDHPGDGWPGVITFTPETLERYIVGPSGLRLVDDPDTTISPASLATDWPLIRITRDGAYPPEEIVLNEHGYQYTSVSLVLRKPKP